MATTGTAVGIVQEQAADTEVKLKRDAELELPADDLDVVAERFPDGGPQGVKCDVGYCVADYCKSGYSSDGK